jgi:hypothetical protein
LFVMAKVADGATAMARCEMDVRSVTGATLPVQSMVDTLNAHDGPAVET